MPNHQEGREFQHPRDRLVERAMNPRHGQVESKHAVVSPVELREGMELSTHKWAGFNPLTQNFEKGQNLTMHPTACGHYIFSPGKVGRRCPRCARTWRVRLSAKPRIICSDCDLCLHCLKREHDARHATGVHRVVCKILLWPLGLDVKF